MEFLLLTIVILALVVVQGVRPAPLAVTSYELYRRSTSSDAVRALKRASLLSSLQALRNIAISVLMLLLLYILVDLFRLGLVALVWTLVLSTFAWAVSSIPFVQSFVYRYVGRFEPKVIALAKILDRLTSYGSKREPIASKKPFHSKEELLEQINHDNSVLSRNEKLHVIQTLVYESTAAKEFMTRMSDVVTVNHDDVIGPLLLDRLHKVGFEHYPVLGPDGRIHGILSLDESLIGHHDKTVADCMSMRVSYARIDMGLDALLSALLRSSGPLLIVVNDRGEYAGIVSLSDVIEQIIGRRVKSSFDFTDISDVAEHKE